jgi:hypothetical protein
MLPPPPLSTTSASLLVGAPPPPLAVVSPAPPSLPVEPPPPDLPAMQPVAVADNTAEDWSEFSGMAISTVVHSILFLTLAMLVTLPEDKAPAVQVVSSFEEPDASFEEPAMLPVELPLESLEELDEPIPEVTETDIADVDTSGSFDPSEVAGFSGPLPDSIAGADTMLADFGSVLAGGGAGGGNGFGGDIGRRLTRAGAKTGAIQISLSWNNFNDLDLHVVPPSEERISFSHRRSKCGGMLDVDMNANGRQSEEPVENVFWSRKTAPAGTFLVYVHFFAQHDEYAETPFELHVLVDGVKTSYKGVAGGDSRLIQVTEFHRKRGGTTATATTDVDDFQE